MSLVEIDGSSRHSRLALHDNTDIGVMSSHSSFVGVKPAQPAFLKIFPRAMVVRLRMLWVPHEIVHWRASPLLCVFICAPLEEIWQSICIKR